jgi:hypothetical protein
MKFIRHTIDCILHSACPVQHRHISPLLGFEVMNLWERFYLQNTGQEVDVIFAASQRHLDVIWPVTSASWCPLFFKHSHGTGVRGCCLSAAVKPTLKEFIACYQTTVRNIKKIIRRRSKPQTKGYVYTKELLSYQQKGRLSKFCLEISLLCRFRVWKVNLTLAQDTFERMSLGRRLSMR